MSVSPDALVGRRIVVTRAKAQATELIERLSALGAQVIACPAISIRPADDSGPLDEALRELTVFDWVVFTSANAVRSIVDRLSLAGRDPETLLLVRIAAVGAATGRALLACGVSASRIPDRFSSVALVESMGDVRDLRILLPRSDIALPTLPDALRTAGALVHEVTAYRTVPADDIARLLGGPADGRTGGGGLRLAGEAIDVIAFTSPSTARYFLDGLSAAGALEQMLADERRPAVICIGPTTADAIRQKAAALPVDAIAEVHDNEGLVDAIVRWCGRKEGKSWPTR